eukprot:7341829-Prorocentrum_lima.AAC.1
MGQGSVPTVNGDDPDIQILARLLASLARLADDPGMARPIEAQITKVSARLSSKNSPLQQLSDIHRAK